MDGLLSPGRVWEGGLDGVALTWRCFMASRGYLNTLMKTVKIAELKNQLADSDGETRSREARSAQRQDRVAAALGEAAQRIERIAHKMRDVRA